MIIKTFSAESTTDALKQIRRELGRDAVVLCTRQMANGRVPAGVEITAAIDHLPLGLAMNPIGEPAKTESVLPAPAITDTSWRQLELIYDRLLEADLPQESINQVMSCVISEGAADNDAGTAARRALARLLAAHIADPPEFKPNDRVLFLGPAGAGKSSALGKLAARLVVQQRRKVMLAGLEHSRIGAHDELAGYADLLQVKLTDVFADARKESGDSGSIILIDGPSLPRGQKAVNTLRDKIARVEPTWCLAVFSALTRTSDVTELCDAIRPLGPTQVVVSMLDQTWRLGSALAVAATLNRPIVFVTNAPGGCGELNTPNPDKLAATLLPVETRHD